MIRSQSLFQHDKRHLKSSVNIDVLNDIIKCKYTTMEDGDKQYAVIPASPCVGILYVINNFISGSMRMRGESNGSYPTNYLAMINNLFGHEPNTIEACSGNVTGCYTVDINPDKHPILVGDAQTLRSVQSNRFSRWRCDPPFNIAAAKRMYGTSLPLTIKLLKAGSRVCKTGSLMFLLLGPQNYQITPPGTKRIGWIAITVVPNNEIRCLQILYKYA